MTITISDFLTMGENGDFIFASILVTTTKWFGLVKKSEKKEIFRYEDTSSDWYFVDSGRAVSRDCGKQAELAEIIYRKSINDS